MSLSLELNETSDLEAALPVNRGCSNKKIFHLVNGRLFENITTVRARGFLLRQRTTIHPKRGVSIDSITIFV